MDNDSDEILQKLCVVPVRDGRSPRARRPGRFELEPRQDLDQLVELLCPALCVIAWLGSIGRPRPVPPRPLAPGPPTGSPPVGFRRPGLCASGRRHSAPALRPSNSRKTFNNADLWLPGMRWPAGDPRSIDMTCGGVIPRAMPKAARVERGAEYLPKYGGRRSGAYTQAAAPRQAPTAVRAAILRREGTSGEPHGMV